MKISKRILSLLLALALCLGLAPLLPRAEAAGVTINSTNFPDANFRSYVSSNFDTNHDSYLNDSEINSIWRIDVHEMGVTDMKGVEYFTALEELNCSLNPKITSLNVSRNKSLKYLFCAETKITSLDLSSNKNLKVLSCVKTKITMLDVTRCCLDELMVQDCANLKTLYCQGNNLRYLVLIGCTALETLNCGDNRIGGLAADEAPALKTLNCEKNGMINLHFGTALESLNCSENSLTNLKVSSCKALKQLDCSYNELTSLDVMQNSALEVLSCSQNLITILFCSTNERLKELSCSHNLLTNLSFSNNAALEKLYCYDNDIDLLIIAGCPHLSAAYRGTRSEDSDGVPYWKYQSGSYTLAVDKTTEIIVSHDLGNYTFDFRSGPVEHPGFDIALELVVMANQGDIGISSGGGYVSLLDLDLDGHSDVRVYSKDGKSYFYVDSHTNLRGTYTLTVSEAVKNAFVSSDLDYYSSFTFQYPSPWNPFTDVKEGKDYYDAILWAYYHDPQVTAGVTATTFGVGKAVKRGDAMFYLWVAAGKPEPTLTKSPFTDVTDPKAYYYKAILWAYENGITSGVSATEFGRKKTVSRRDMLVFLYKQQGSPVPTLTQSPYSDVTDPKAYYYKAVLWAYEKGIEKGAGGKFNGKTNCLRETVVLWMYRVLAG